MSWPIWCEIVCKKCADTVAGRFNDSVLNKNKMRVETQRSGWQIRDDDWLCKACIEKEGD